MLSFIYSIKKTNYKQEKLTNKIHFLRFFSPLFFKWLTLHCMFVWTFIFMKVVLFFCWLEHTVTKRNEICPYQIVMSRNYIRTRKEFSFLNLLANSTAQFAHDKTLKHISQKKKKVYLFVLSRVSVRRI